MPTLWIDASNGAAGDMLLAALLDAGASIDRVRAALAGLGVAGVHIDVAEVRRHGLRALRAEVEGTSALVERTLPDVLALLDGGGLDHRVRQFAGRVFSALADAEARVHGTTVDHIHFHEVGALDAIADVVGCAVALDDLDVLGADATVVVSTVGVGSGSVRSQHGVLPVPAPAVVELLSAAGAPVSGAGPAFELCTPTGAALLTVLADSWGASPPMRLSTAGVGAGKADPPDHANVTRVLLGDPLETATLHHDLMLVETTIDDLEPRLLPGVLDALVRAGAHDAWATHAHMRKSRPGLVISALCRPDVTDTVFAALVQHSPTLGARTTPVGRMSLRRSVATVTVEGQPISVKCGWLGDRLVTATPEFAEVVQAATALGLSQRAVLAAADRAAARLYDAAARQPETDTLATRTETRSAPVNLQQADRMTSGRGFIAALDQSGGSTPKALKLYGIDETAYSSEQEMFDLIHQMRTRIITSPVFGGDRVLAAILFEQTMDREIDGKPSAAYLWEDKGIVPILKIDKGLADAALGVQVMKPIPGLDELLDRAVQHGIFGTKERSVIGAANPAGITAIVEQQFKVAGQVLAHGLVPILEPEVTISIEDKAQAEDILRDVLTTHLDGLPEGTRVMLKLSIPTQANHYLPLIEHPRVMRVVALSGGYSRDEADALLAQNTGLIASFSRALTEGLTAGQSDAAFNTTLDHTIESIYQASNAG